MRILSVLTLMIFMVSCGKGLEEKKITNKSLQLNGIQSTGVNLGSGVQGAQKLIMVTCSDEIEATNNQRLVQLTNLQNSLQSGTYVNFTIVGVEITPTQMSTLLQQAQQNLNYYSAYQRCPSNILASIPVN